MTIKDFVLQSWLNFCWFMFVCAERHSSIESWWNDRCVYVQLKDYQPDKFVQQMSFWFAVKVLGR